MSTLTLANQIKTDRARLRDELRRGELAFPAAFDEPALANMLVFDLLMSLPPGRKARGAHRRSKGRPTLFATSLFAHIQRGPLTRVSDLTGRERDVLIRAYDRMTR